VLVVTRSSRPLPVRNIGHPHATGDQSVDGVAPGATKRAVPVPEQDRHVARAEIGDREVELAVPVEITDLGIPGDQPGRVIDRGGEGAVPVAEQDGDVVRDEVGRDQIDGAVVPEIAGVQRGGKQAIRTDLHRRGKGPVTAAHEDRDVVGEQVVDEEIRLAVAVDVGNGHPGRPEAQAVQAEEGRRTGQASEARHWRRRRAEGRYRRAGSP